MRRTPLISLVLTVFIDMLGFSIILPVLPYYARAFGASALVVGLLFASYSFMQFLLSPVWGRVSDRVGRKPIIVVGLVGAAVGFVIFGLAETLTVLFISRMLSGGMAATIPVAQAYVADITPPEERARAMGLLGAALGLGFIVGPAAGGMLEQFGQGMPAFVAAGLASANALWTGFALPESLHPEVRRERWLPINALHEALRRPSVTLTLVVFFVSLFAFAAMEGTFALLVEDHFFTGRSQAELARRVGYLFGFSGVITVIVQGGLLGRLAKLFGERRLIPLGLALTAIGLVLLPVGDSLGWLLLALGVLSLGNAFIRPTTASLLSGLVSGSVQGGVLSVNQALASLARATGPAWGGYMYHSWGHASPFLAGGVIVCVSFVGSVVLAVMLSSSAPVAEPDIA